MTLSILYRMDKCIHLRFYHQGEFQPTRYAFGKETVVRNVDLDRFSYSELMGYVKDDLKYTEIGGLYVSKGEQGGWMLVSDDRDLSTLTAGIKHGDHLDFYLDNVIDNNIEPINQMQPWVRVCPRQDLFAGKCNYSVLP